MIPSAYPFFIFHGSGDKGKRKNGKSILTWVSADVELPVVCHLPVGIDLWNKKYISSKFSIIQASGRFFTLR
uniref:Uncharacterized protein n=1 Tax=Anguilla anguilla TaxID=7936 RepID=A0A0E9Q042_ANGAN